MKKLIFILAIITGLIPASIYVFIPNQLHINQTVTIHAPESVIDKFLVRESGWNKWWPDGKTILVSPSYTTYSYAGTSYRFNKSTLSSVEVEIIHRDFINNSTLDFVVGSLDSIRTTWHTTVATSLNPIKRLIQYQQAKIIKEGMAGILRHAKMFLEKDKNIYGITIQYNKVTDSLILQTHTISKTYPKTAEIYALIKELRAAIIQYGAKENNYPMLNITQLQDKTYQIMVGIPINKRIPTTGKDMAIKEMVLGNILMAEVKGGQYTVSNSLEQMHNYIRDHRHTSPAIPFESLVTDRMNEPDTSKWITRIYYPIF